MKTILTMCVPESDFDVRTCQRLNQIDELAYVLGKTKEEISCQALQYIRPEGHPRGRQYYSGAVAELYADYRINAPHLFQQAKAPVLYSILGQIRSLHVECDLANFLSNPASPLHEADREALTDLNHSVRLALGDE